MVDLHAQSWGPDREGNCGTDLALDASFLNILQVSDSVEGQLVSKVFVFIMSMNRMKLLSRCV
jgi:hypothetical protein